MENKQTMCVMLHLQGVETARIAMVLGIKNTVATGWIKNALADRNRLVETLRPDVPAWNSHWLPASQREQDRLTENVVLTPGGAPWEALRFEESDAEPSGPVMENDGTVSWPYRMNVMACAHERAHAHGKREPTDDWAFCSTGRLSCLGVPDIAPLLIEVKNEFWACQLAPNALATGQKIPSEDMDVLIGRFPWLRGPLFAVLSRRRTDPALRDARLTDIMDALTECKRCDRLYDVIELLGYNSVRGHKNGRSWYLIFSLTEGYNYGL